MEMSLFGSVASGKLESVLDALERSCGPPSDWSLLETTFSLEKTDAKVMGIFVPSFFFFFFFFLFVLPGSLDSRTELDANRSSHSSCPRDYSSRGRAASCVGASYLSSSFSCL
jgi:hypothetical protein